MWCDPLCYHQCEAPVLTLCGHHFPTEILLMIPGLEEGGLKCDTICGEMGTSRTLEMLTIRVQNTP